MISSKKLFFYPHSSLRTGYAKCYFAHLLYLILGRLTSSMYPLTPFDNPPTSAATREIVEFLDGPAECLIPYTTYKNFLYIRPTMLAYEGQKIFQRARNLSCTIQVKDVDNEDSPPLPVSSHLFHLKISYFISHKRWWNFLKFSKRSLVKEKCRN